jgi:regulator of replication initiation timing
MNLEERVQQLEHRIEHLERQHEDYTAQIMQILAQNSALADESFQLTRRMVDLTDPWRAIKHVVKRFVYPF